jgi:hypothetical protein
MHAELAITDSSHSALVVATTEWGGRFPSLRFRAHYHQSEIYGHLKDEGLTAKVPPNTAGLQRKTDVGSLGVWPLTMSLLSA